MYFSPHRNKAGITNRIQALTLGAGTLATPGYPQDSDYDSLWSDSEEEEFPVNPSRSDLDSEDDGDLDEDEASSKCILLTCM